MSAKKDLLPEFNQDTLNPCFIFENRKKNVFRTWIERHLFVVRSHAATIFHSAEGEIGFEKNREMTACKNHEIEK